jgi:hypothetical protein
MTAQPNIIYLYPEKDLFPPQRKRKGKEKIIKEEEEEEEKKTFIISFREKEKKEEKGIKEFATESIEKKDSLIWGSREIFFSHASQFEFFFYDVYERVKKRIYSLMKDINNEKILQIILEKKIGNNNIKYTPEYFAYIQSFLLSIGEMTTIINDVRMIIDNSDLPKKFKKEEEEEEEEEEGAKGSLKRLLNAVDEEILEMKKQTTEFFSMIEEKRGRALGVGTFKMKMSKDNFIDYMTKRIEQLISFKRDLIVPSSVSTMKEKTKAVKKSMEKHHDMIVESLTHKDLCYNNLPYIKTGYSTRKLNISQPIRFKSYFTNCITYGGIKEVLCKKAVYALLDFPMVPKKNNILTNIITIIWFTIDYFHLDKKIKEKYDFDDIGSVSFGYVLNTFRSSKIMLSFSYYKNFTKKAPENEKTYKIFTNIDLGNNPYILFKSEADKSKLKDIFEKTGKEEEYIIGCCQTTFETISYWAQGDKTLRETFKEFYKDKAKEGRMNFEELEIENTLTNNYVSNIFECFFKETKSASSFDEISILKENSKLYRLYKNIRIVPKKFSE